MRLCAFPAKIAWRLLPVWPTRPTIFIFPFSSVLGGILLRSAGTPYFGSKVPSFWAFATIPHVTISRLFQFTAFSKRWISPSSLSMSHFLYGPFPVRRESSPSFPKPHSIFSYWSRAQSSIFSFTSQCLWSSQAKSTCRSTAPTTCKFYHWGLRFQPRAACLSLRENSPLLCFALLFGSIFQWFTDNSFSDSASNRTIHRFFFVNSSIFPSNSRLPLSTAPTPPQAT